MYGITAKRLAVKMRCTVEQAEVALSAFQTRFSRYVEWCEEACEYVKAYGHIRTLDGFKRPLDPTLHWDKFRRCNDLHWSVRNQVANSAIQGSVAGIAKIAMVAAKRAFVADGIWDRQVRFRAQEHDSVVVVAHSDVKEHVEATIRRCIVEAVPLRVPMKVDGGWGKSWGEAKG
jgi:DNA polymerase-1